MSGPGARRFRTYHELAEPGGSEVLDQVRAQGERLAARLAAVRRVWLVGSGKGGVGKSALTANLAAALAARGRAVGALDADLNGPCLARMLGVGEDARLEADASGVAPAQGVADVRVVSTDLLLADSDAPLRWRGPAEASFVWQSTLERGTLREFLSDVAWGALDHLLVDLPPGTDKLTRALELLPDPAGVLLVTTPSAASLGVVRRSLRLVRELGVRRVGLVVNMARFTCPACGASTSLFDDAGSAPLTAELGDSAWAEIPFDAGLARRTDAGQPPVLSDAASAAARALLGLAERLDREAP